MSETECRVCGDMWTPHPDGRGHRCEEDAIDYLARIGELFERAEAAEKRAREAEEKLADLTRREHNETVSLAIYTCKRVKARYQAKAKGDGADAAQDCAFEISNMGRPKGREGGE